MSYPTNPPWVPSCASTGAGVEVPDATATPRTDAMLDGCEWGNRQDQEHTRLCRTLERELTSAQAALTAAKAEIAAGIKCNETLQACIEKARQTALALQSRVEHAEAQLRERTQWRCACGGTDCAGQAENERLRARVGDLENDLEKSKHEADDWHRAWETVTEQAKKEVAELEENKARLIAVVIPHIDDLRGTALAIVRAGYASALKNTIAEIEKAADELRAAIAAARAGKGAT